jgi:hypothetical protein
VCYSNAGAHVKAYKDAHESSDEEAYEISYIASNF